MGNSNIAYLYNIRSINVFYFYQSKLYHKVDNKALLEHSLDVFKQFSEIKKTIIVFNKSHKKYLNALNLKNVNKPKVMQTNEVAIIHL